MPLPIRAIGPVFTPRHMSKLAWWIDPSDRSSVTLDGVSGKISEIADRGPRARNATQTTDANRPSLGTLNGLGCIDQGTSASNINMTIPTSNAIASQEICAVCKLDITNATWPDILYVMESAIGSTGGTTNWLSVCNEAGYIGCEFLTNAISGSSGVLSDVKAGAVVFAWSPASGFNTTRALARLGNQTDFLNRSWRGRIGEVCGFSAELTAEERRRMRLYLAHKWGITAAIY